MESLSDVMIKSYKCKSLKNVGYGTDAVSDKRFKKGKLRKCW